MDLKKYDTRPAVVPIKKIVRENDIVNTYVFEYPLGAEPGQFVMLWIPGVDEKPISVAYDDGKVFWLTVCKVGPGTQELFKLKKGDKVGIRGPFGTKYKFDRRDNLALVAGGYGAAPMYFVANEAVKKGCGIDFLIGARNKDLLIYTQKVMGLNDVRLHIATDDGSAGFEGYITQVLEDVLGEDPEINKVFTCGPEPMMKVVGDICAKAGIDCWLSIEKYMKCGFGVCGQCAVDDTGELVCKKGPVMSYDYVRKLPEFGKYYRDAQGQKHYFKS
ncbi:dihydroorotate dehydrogenase electron transfer subunit [Candidatus Peregrinibacteria bacterium]|nr:dihydroorotate dehydrogenase electron transfer subunit [Candidatus Peregrinibacteria bacterium]